MTHAVLLHPLVAYGGNQYNHVITALHDQLLRTQITPHRFDFSSGTLAESQAEAVAQIEACDGPVVLMGYSYGGEVAATITHPAGVDRSGVGDSAVRFSGGAVSSGGAADDCLGSASEAGGDR